MLWFFVIGLISIVFGIVYEQRLIAFENKIFKKARSVFDDRKRTSAEKSN